MMAPRFGRFSFSILVSTALALSLFDYDTDVHLGAAPFKHSGRSIFISAAVSSRESATFQPPSIRNFPAEVLSLAIIRRLPPSLV
jgi:hypothetical protein